MVKNLPSNAEGGVSILGQAAKVPHLYRAAKVHVQQKELQTAVQSLQPESSSTDRKHNVE